MTDSNHLRYDTGEGGLRRAILTGQGAQAHVYLHGAHVAHWQHADGKPVLWMSKHSMFEPNQPIRGGVPVCMPWFGAHPNNPALPNHGFARLREWQVDDAHVDTDGATVIVLSLRADEQTRQLWPHDFVFRHTISCGRQLRMTLAAENIGHAPFTITEALHSYFAVGDVRHIRVTGLEGAPYLSKVEGGTLSNDGPITITGETDRVYMNTEATCELHDPVMNRRIIVSKHDAQSTVVWNPWVEKTKAMPDFGDNEWPGMLCIETANVLDNAVIIRPGQSHTMTATIDVG
jgi:glucose-6-phosphate 1-epimerase